MKLVRRWLLPALTCLLVLGAAALPPYISQMRDAKQFGQVHAQALEADPLPAVQASTLLDRMTLYASRLSSNRTILSSTDYSILEDGQETALAQSAQELLTGSGVLPAWIFEEEPFGAMRVSRLLLWDAEDKWEPSVFWDVTWENYTNKSHQKSVHVTLDAQTGLPIHLYVHDTNMSQWMAYDVEHLRSLTQRYSNLWGLEVQEVDLAGSMFVPSVNVSYSISGTGLYFSASRGPTDLAIQLDTNWTLRSGDGTISTGYDG